MYVCVHTRVCVHAHVCACVSSSYCVPQSVTQLKGSRQGVKCQLMRRVRASRPALSPMAMQQVCRAQGAQGHMRGSGKPCGVARVGTHGIGSWNHQQLISTRRPDFSDSRSPRTAKLVPWYMHPQ